MNDQQQALLARFYEPDWEPFATVSESIRWWRPVAELQQGIDDGILRLVPTLPWFRERQCEVSDFFVWELVYPSTGATVEVGTARKLRNQLGAGETFAKARDQALALARALIMSVRP